MKWYDHLVPCKCHDVSCPVHLGKSCHYTTHFSDWDFQSTDTLRRKRKGFCADCWDEFRKTPEYQQMLEEIGRKG